jgi:hypothetical protein
MTDQSTVAEVTLGFAPGLIRDAERWHGFIARLESVRAYNDKLPDHTRKYRICEQDTVSIKRELLVNEHHVPCGSLGIVTVERDHGRLYDVRFFCAPSVAITIFGCDLQIAL